MTCQTLDENTVLIRDTNALEFTVDLSSDCLIIRASQKHPQKGSLLWDYDLTITRDSENVCIPDEWTLREWKGDSLIRTTTAVVTEFSYREQLSKADFQLELPASLELFDQTLGETGDHGHVRTPTPVAQSANSFNYFWLMIIFCAIFTAVVSQRYLRRKPNQ